MKLSRGMLALAGVLLLIVGLGGGALAWQRFGTTDTFLPSVSTSVEDAPPAGLYDLGSPTLTDLWVDPINGNDGNSGSSRAEALRTVTAAWGRVPRGVTLTTTGYRLQLVAGHHDQIPTYWESRWGTFQFPILLNAVDGAGTATIPSPNLFDVRYLYFLGVAVRGGNGGDGFHCEACDHLLLRQVRIDGNATQPHGVQEALKVNQSRHVYIEQSDIFGGGDNAVDFVGVQVGHALYNTVHDADDWCMYLKGGSAYFRVEGNEYHSCGTGGFTAGQGTGFEYMVPPWLHYEAYDIKFVNNVIHDTEGAGMGVNGGYNILLAYNTLYRVGQRSHVIEVVHGRRGCDGDATTCQAHQAQGGWGLAGPEEQFIPNRNVFVYNNIVYNPSGYQSQWQHFAIPGPVTPPAGSNVPAPAHADSNLQIRGNLIWNGPASHPLGVEGGEHGCPPANPTCNESQLRAENSINTIAPQLVAPATGDFRPVAGGTVFSAPTYAIPDFAWSDAPSPPPVPSGTLTNVVPRDRAGHPRPATNPPGAYVGP